MVIHSGYRWWKVIIKVIYFDEGTATDYLDMFLFITMIPCIAEVIVNFAKKKERLK